MLRVLCLVISLCCLGDAALDLEQLQELLKTLEITVPPAIFSRVVTKDDGLKLNTRKQIVISEEAVIGETSSSVTVLKAELSNNELNKKYCIYSHGTEMIEASSAGAQLLHYVFVFVSKNGEYPTDTEVGKMLKTGIKVTVDVGERKCSLSPVLFGSQIVENEKDSFGLRIPQARLSSFELNDLSDWSSISYKNAVAETINLEISENKEYYYAIPANKVKHPEVPDNVKVAVIETNISKQYGLLKNVTSLVVKVYNSGSIENKVQLDFRTRVVTNSLMLKGYQDGSNKEVCYDFEQPDLWRLVKFKST